MTCPRCECKHVFRPYPNSVWVRCRYCGKTYRFKKAEDQKPKSSSPQKKSSGIINPFKPDSLSSSPEKEEDNLDILDELN